MFCFINPTFRHLCRFVQPKEMLCVHLTSTQSFPTFCVSSVISLASRRVDMTTKKHTVSSTLVHHAVTFLQRTSSNSSVAELSPSTNQPQHISIHEICFANSTQKGQPNHVYTNSKPTHEQKAKYQ